MNELGLVHTYKQTSRTLQLLTVIGFLIFLGFVAGTTRERARWAQALGPCDLPATQLDALLIFRTQSGTFYCQPRSR